MTTKLALRFIVGLAVPGVVCSGYLSYHELFAATAEFRPAPGTPPRDGAASLDPRAAVFLRHGCNECHAITGLGVRAKSDVGPDLTFAYAEVLLRYGVTLEYFLERPFGVMRLVLLSVHTDIPAADRDSMVQVLRRLHEVQRAGGDEAPEPIGDRLARRDRW